MRVGPANKKLIQLMAIGTPITSAFLLTGIVTDPVNATKLFILGGLALSAGALLFFKENFESLAKDRALVTISILFLLSLCISLFHASGPFIQSFYGAYGRNTGFLTYFLLLILLVSATGVKDAGSAESLFKGFMATGLLNTLYCAWVLVFGDFIGWNNVYGNILGLFGNSDFISAFLGMFATGIIAILFDSKSSIKLKLLLSAILVLAVFEIYKSKAIQGFLVAAVGVSVISLLWLRSKTRSNLPTIIYGASLLSGAVIAVLGMLQMGPASFIYKRSVSFRGTYWYVAEKLGFQNPLTGAGLDSYGDWYRRLRPAKALVDTPGPTITSNVAHNVVLDLFASGGWPLLISYIALIILALISTVKVLRNSRTFDKNYYALVAIWLGYQAQSLISINQVGLAVWGWILTGLLISYSRFSTTLGDTSQTKNTRQNSRKTNQSQNIFSPGLVMGLGFVLGALISVPPLSADMNWMSAIKSRNVTTVEKALQPTYLNPANSMKYAQAIGVFQESKLDDLAHTYALIAIKFNPNFFDTWRQLYFLPNSTGAEKKLALENMKRLDPLNPDVAKP